MADGRHALVVATSKYGDVNLRKLVTPGFDAKELARVLRDDELGGFDLQMLRDKDSHLVARAIEKFFAERSPDDTVVLYFSGHGVKDDAGNLYLAARDTTRQLLRSTGIADGFLRDVMKSCRARRQVLILDCCFGGAFAKGLLAKGAGDTVEVNERFQGQGRVILTASTAMEFAFEEEGVSGKAPLSVFTRTLVAGIQTGDADSDNDGQVSVQDLYDYAYKRIAVAGARQTPTISSVGQEGSIFLSRVPASARKLRAPQAYVKPGIASARRLGLRPWTRIHDQGQEGANPAVAAITALETYLARRGREVSLSVRYVYQKAKQIAEQDPNVDGGIEMTVLTKVMQEYGAPLEEDWPFVPGKVALPPGKTWKVLDERAKVHRARLIPATTADDIRHHLSQDRPVLAAFSVYESWMAESTGRTGVVPKPAAKEQLLGSIATTIVDYDEERRVLQFAHTWGPNWGERGFGEMTEDTAQALFKDDQMWAVEVPGASSFWQQEPAPIETPKPRRPPKRASKPTKERRATTATPAARAVFDARGGESNWSEETLPARALARGENDPPTGDEAVDETFDALGAFRDFFQQVFERSSWDGRGAPLEAVVHYGRSFENAFWGGRRVVIGDGGTHFKKFHTIDIVAKELGMGLVQAETELRYEGQAGALIQSLGLVFASLVKQYRGRQSAADANWLIGEGVIEGGRAIVSLENPGTAFDVSVLGKDQQVGHMSQFVKTEEDNGGVHINCGIPNRAFVLAAKEQGGHAWETVGPVWYEVVREGKLPPNATFSKFAQETLRFARKKDDRALHRAVKNAWAAVGIDLA
jgi:Thermolysin metallopeptidase, alpha-helical domain/Caspase domain/Thermolysin metallopeptidase, catalytic domain/Papain family cysteine protease